MIDYERLRYLNQRVNTKNATTSEKDEYMNLLFRSNSITKSQYDKYVADKNAEGVFKTAITIGGIILLGYLIDKITSKS